MTTNLNKAKILYILPSLKNSGPVNMCLSLIKNLAPLYKITVYSLKDGGLKSEFERYCDVKVFTFHSFINLVSDVSGKKYNIVHTHCLVPDVISALLPGGPPRITTIHNYYDIDYIYSKGSFIGRLMGWLNRFAVKRSLKIACSESVRNYCGAFFSTPVFFVRNGIESESQIILSKCSSGLVHFYTLGVLNERKNTEQVLRVFNKWSIDKNAILHVIGDGPDKLRLQQDFNSNMKIIFHGSLEKPSLLVKDYNCMITASKAEGFPLASLEALSLGNAIIASNISPHNEIFSVSKNIIGSLYDSTDDDLDAQLTKYYQSPDKDKLKENALIAYKNNFTAKVMSDGYNRFYNDILK